MTACLVFYCANVTTLHGPLICSSECLYITFPALHKTDIRRYMHYAIYMLSSSAALSTSTALRPSVSLGILHLPMAYEHSTSSPNRVQHTYWSSECLNATQD
ncbi:unnamed protein product [Periconia digitata]|uniref:Uncharacterized protein n=1 Tax=Periconia digitata TaxID=1303443 RepID=A0A9W4UN19_9PLEO|nr:unnamed protein product [Periconia digitata]